MFLLSFFSPPQLRTQVLSLPSLCRLLSPRC